MQLRAVGCALATNGGNASALGSTEAEVFSSLPQMFQNKLIEIFKTPGSFPVKAAEFPILDCLASMVRWKPIDKNFERMFLLVDLIGYYAFVAVSRLAVEHGIGYVLYCTVHLSCLLMLLEL